jgi:hypothetical protein
LCRAFTTDEGAKVKGAAKVAAVMSSIRSSSTFPVSEAANFATPVSRKHLLGDRILLFSFTLLAEVFFPLLSVVLCLNSSYLRAKGEA